MCAHAQGGGARDSRLGIAARRGTIGTPVHQDQEGQRREVGFLSQYNRAARDAVTLLIIFGLLGAAYLLPPDTSYAQLKASGLLRACVPSSYPPLVTGDAEAPGIDVELLQELAERLDLRLLLATNSAMGRDFNPRNWRVTRAQCQILAGGVVDSRTTRSFLETTPPHAETGWALIRPGNLKSLEDRDIGFYAGVSGLDRIGLSRFLRQEGARVSLVSQRSELAEGLSSGRLDAAVAEALSARQLGGEMDWEVEWLPLGRQSVVLGLWKGDLTLKRRVVSALAAIREDGTLQKIVERYEIAPIGSRCAPCEPDGGDAVD